eukprot:1393705-Amphidinium_carterae.1
MADIKSLHAQLQREFVRRWWPYHPTPIHYKINSPNPQTVENYKNKFPYNKNRQEKQRKKKQNDKSTGFHT